MGSDSTLSQASVEVPPSGLFLHRQDELLPQLVLLHLHLHPQETEQSGGAGVTSSGLENCRHAILTGEDPGSDPIHDHVTVSLEQRHQRLHAIDHRFLLRGGEQTKQT